MKKNIVSIPITGIVILALLITLNILLTHPLAINTETIRIGFGFLPIAIAAIIYGPLWASVVAVIGDILGAFLFPTGPFFPGFTLTALLTAIVFGVFLYNKKITLKRMIIPSLLICIILNLGLDTFWLFTMYGKGVIAQIPFRILKTVIMIALQIGLTPIIWRSIFPVISKIKKA